MTGNNFVLAVLSLKRADEQRIQNAVFCDALGQFDHALIFDHLVRMIFERDEIFQFDNERFCFLNGGVGFVIRNNVVFFLDLFGRVFFLQGYFLHFNISLFLIRRSYC